MMGLYLQSGESSLSRGLQLLGSCVILVGPFLLVTAFVSEPWLPDLVRPYARPAIYIAFGGTIFHLLAKLSDRIQPQSRG